MPTKAMAYVILPCQKGGGNKDLTENFILWAETQILFFYNFYMVVNIADNAKTQGCKHAYTKADNLVCVHCPD